MRVGLPNTQSGTVVPDSLREEISEAFASLRSYYAADLSDDVQGAVRIVAADPEVSEKIISRLVSELPEAHRKYLRVWTICLAVYFLPLVITPLSRLFSERAYLFLTDNHPFGASFFGFPFIWFLIYLGTAEYALLEYLEWRSKYRDAYIADYLIRSLEIGLMYRSDPTNEDLRDRFATSIQRAAIKYLTIYKRSDSTRFFAAQVRSQARACRNNIISIVPGLVTADQGMIEVINTDLARLLIRSQTGYWYQTGDIARPGMPMRRRDAIRISLASFIRDRSIQVAILALAATLAAALIASLASHLGR
jgi:hypothetical protein